MTVHNALLFIKQGMTDSDLRFRLNNTASQDELDQVLAEQSMLFSPHEFEQAFSQKLVQCQEIGQAEQLHQFRMWWTILYQAFESGKGDTSYSGCRQNRG